MPLNNKIMYSNSELFTKDARREIDRHIDRVRLLMEADNLDAVLIASNVNICYLTLRFFRGYVWVPRNGQPLWFVIRPVGLAADDVLEIRKPEQIPAILTERGVSLQGTLGLELGELTYNDINRLSTAMAPFQIKDCTMTMKHARMVKTEWEQQKMREDGALQSQVYSLIPSLFREGMTDVDLQIAIETQLRRHGCLGRSRVSGSLMEINLGSVLAGSNADNPSPYDFAMGGAGVDPSLPGGADGQPLEVHTTVMIDMNGCFNLYQSDMTRTWRIGEVSELAMKAHECSRTILRKLEEIGQPGLPVAQLYNQAIAIAEEQGLTAYFMGHRQKVAFIGHGVGLELNELPVVMARSRDILQEGMTIALEPKFVIPEVGAVGVENTYIVTASGLQSITPGSEDLDNLL